nr:isomaltulose synthase [Raoultella sp. NCTC 9187]
MSFIKTPHGGGAGTVITDDDLGLPSLSATPSFADDIDVHKENTFPAWWKEAVFLSGVSAFF